MTLSPAEVVKFAERQIAACIEQVVLKPRIYCVVWLD